MMSVTRERPVAHHRRRQLAAGDILLDEQHVGHVVAELRRAVGALDHQVDPDRGALVVRLHHVGRRHRVAPAHLLLADEPPGRHRQAGGGEDRLGAVLVHGERRGEHARSGCRGCASHSRMPWTQPSSPQRPCSALKATSGAAAASADARSSPASISTTSNPSCRNAAAHSRPDTSDTSRSAERPPISTAMRAVVLLDMPASTCPRRPFGLVGSSSFSRGRSAQAARPA